MNIPSWVPLLVSLAALAIAIRADRRQAELHRAQRVRWTPEFTLIARNRGDETVILKFRNDGVATAYDTQVVVASLGRASASQLRTSYSVEPAEVHTIWLAGLSSVRGLTDTVSLEWYSRPHSSLFRGGKQSAAVNVRAAAQEFLDQQPS